MAEIANQSRAEDAAAAGNDFMWQERGTGLDGSHRAGQVAGRAASTAEWAQWLLTAVPHPKHGGLYIPLSRHNANKYHDAVAALPGYVTLVPSALVEPGTAAFYPAVVSEDSLRRQELRLHVLRQPYRQHLGYAASLVLSAAGQSETPGTGEHWSGNTGVEAEHFTTLLATASDKWVQQNWQSGQHINHEWRGQGNNSVSSEANWRLFGQEIPQVTLTLTQQQITNGEGMLLWHEGLRGGNGQPETAARDNALVIMQGLGYQALSEHNPGGIDAIKRLLA